MEKIEKLHNLIWKRFIRMPQGHLLDNADENGNTILPSKSDCEKCYPNPLSWLTGIENGGFFGGLYLYALVTDYDKNPTENRKNEIMILANGLFILCDVSETDGFIARGVADDGSSHYPVSSEDQVGPWLLGLWKLYNSSVCDDETKKEISKRIAGTVKGIYQSEYRIPTEWKDVYRGSYANDDWRGVCKAMFCGMLIDEFAPDLNNQKEYIRLRDEKPNNSLFTRKEIASHGFAPDMIKNTGLIQFWIDVCAHLCLKELSKYDENSASYYQKGLLSNGEVAIKFCEEYKKYKNTDVFLSAPDWKKLSVSEECKNPDKMFEITNVQFKEWESIFPSYHNEHHFVCDTFSAVWIAITCGSDVIMQRAKEALSEAIDFINFDTMWYSYGFFGESAYYMLP